MKRFFVLMLLCVALLAQPVFAHTTGASWNQTSGPYTVDVGYDPATFTAGQYTRFDFLLWKGAVNTGEQFPYAQIWIRIVNADHNTYLATGIWRQPVGPTTLLYDFDQPGTYTLETSYRDADGNDIAVASFPINVQSASGSAPSIFVVSIGVFLVGVLIGAGVSARLFQRKNERAHRS